jgi:hypothetical protein
LGAHIITCDTKEKFQEFVTKGYAGVRPIPPKTLTERGLKRKIETNWDIIADLKRVKPGDIIFLHVAKKIYGLFNAASYFMEEESIPDVYKGENLNLPFWIENKSFWMKGMGDREYDEVRESVDYHWKVSIKSSDDLFFDRGLDIMKIFKLKTIGEIQSIPERFLYDGEKTVKPLLAHDTETIVELLKKENEGVRSTMNIEPYNMSKFQKIKLDLHSYQGELSCEKILEAYIMENITYNGTNLKAHEEIKKIVGDVDFFANTVFTYYTNFMDVFCQRKKEDGSIRNIIIELKKGSTPSPRTENVIEKLQQYMNWVKYFMEKGKHVDNELFGIIIAKRVTKPYIKWKKQNADSNIKLVEYDFSEDGSYLKFNLIEPKSV